jgi:polysaccharide deacetylase family protein (PEP-CTERM system associated)
MNNGLSIDVEDYYQIIYKTYFNSDTPPTIEVERNTHYLLDTLSLFGVKATFFLLCNVARQFPPLVKRIVHEGHEIAVHGYDHSFVFAMQPAEFRTAVTRAKEEIEQCAGAQAVGYRAPAFSLNQSSLWAIDILKESGFLYDASIKNIKKYSSCTPCSEKSMYRWPNGLYEIPLSCISILGQDIPVAGGGYLRHFPYLWTKYALKKLERNQKHGIVYMHPYEFEDSYPHINYHNKPLPLKLRLHTILQARNRGEKHRSKCNSLLSDFNFVPLKTLMEQHTAT